MGNYREDISNELIDFLKDCDDFEFNTSGSLNIEDGGYREYGYIRGGGITIHRDDNEGFCLSVEGQVKTINILELNKKWISLSNDDHLIIWDSIRYS
jgi:hypothetical protein